MAAAETSIRRQLEIHEMRARQSPENNDCWVGVASALVQLGTLRTRAGWLDQAQAPFERAMNIYARLAREDPTAKQYRIHIADAYYHSASFLLATGRADDAAAALRQARDLYDQLVQEDPTNPGLRRAIANTCYQLGHVQRVAGQLRAAEATYNQALDLFEDLADGNPASGGLRRSIGGARFHIGLVQSVTGRHPEAVRSWTTALGDFRTAAELGQASSGLVSSIAEAQAQLGQWKDAADTLAASSDNVDYASKRRCQLALLQWMAGDEEGYRATCRELVSRCGSESTALESAAIAMLSLIDSKANENSTVVLEIARRAASADRRAHACQFLVGAAQYRAGQRQEALNTLERSQPLDDSAESSVTPQGCSARANRLLGETMLALTYHEAGNDEAFARQLAALRNSIERAKATVLQYCDDDERWRIGLAVLFAERELARLQVPASR
jgi:tetratricopeptide (TPR) repeat protein